LAAEFRLAKRPVQRLAKNVLGLDISLGMIAKLERLTATVLQPVDDALAQAVRSASHSHVDETPWREANGKAWMWVGTGPNVTHYRISRHRDGTTARQVLGDDPEKVVICDRFSAYSWVKKKQWCWAHLRRDFQAMIDRNDGGSELGKRLLKLSDNLFWGWHRQASGEVTRPQWLEWANSVRDRVHQELSQGASCPSRKTGATCRQLLEGKEHLWRFVENPGIEPTNNSAERALRHGVLWRKSSGGTASVGGSQFVSRLLGVVATCRQQRRLVLNYLTSCLEATHLGQAVPMLC
jgi:transposase